MRSTKQKRHLCTLVCSLLAFSLIFTACGTTSKSTNPSQPNNTAKQESQIVLKAGHNNVADYPHGKMIHHFADKVAELSKNHIKVDVFDNGALGQEDQLFQGMRMGTVDMAKTGTSIDGSTVPSFLVFDLPYLLKSQDQMFKVLNGPIGEKMLKELETKAGVKGLFWMDQGTRNIYSNKPIRKPEDLKGLKIRAINSPVMVDTINAMGAAATPMAFGELYTALRQRLVDGAENSPDTIWYSKHYEVAKYYNMTEHFRTPVLFQISMKTWNKLSPEDQKVIIAASKETAEWGKNLYQEEADKLLQQMKSQGLEVITDVDLDAFKKSVQSVYQKNQDKIGVDLIKEIQAQ